MNRTAAVAQPSRSAWTFYGRQNRSALGVQRIAALQILEGRGFKVLLVNARHVKNVPGRKSDMIHCQWLQQLHTFGLLRGSLRPSDPVCVLRS